MSFNEKVASFLGLATKEDLKKRDEMIFSQERLIGELKLSKDTSPSGLALNQLPRETAQNTNVRKKQLQLQNLYFTNQFIFRGINIRADELITRGFDVVGGDAKGIKLCRELIDRSGGVQLFRRCSINTDVYGDCWLEYIWNKNKKNPILMFVEQIHPATFGYKTKDNNLEEIELNENGRPIGFEQRTVSPDNEGELRIPVDKKKIAHLMFNQVADEFTGLSIIQPLYDTAVRLMNMEESAAYAAVKSANPIWIGESEAKSPHELYKWSTVLGRISGKDQIFLPKGMKLRMEAPGRQNFNDYAEYFLDAVVAALGVPKVLLLGGGDANRATSIVQTRYFQSLIETNQLMMARFFNKVFERYGKIANFDPPKLVFNEIMEDLESQGDIAIRLFDSGIITQEEARSLIGIERLNGSKTNVNFESDVKKNDKKVFFPREGKSREGSQEGNKAKQKKDIGVPSVR